MSSQVRNEAGTRRVNVVIAGGERILVRADTHATNHAIFARPKLDETDRLSIEPLEQKILV